MTILLTLLLAPKPAIKPEVKPPRVGSWASYTMSDASGRTQRWLRFAVVGGGEDGRRRYEIEVKDANLGQGALIAYEVDASGTMTNLILQPGVNAPPLRLPVSQGKAIDEARHPAKKQKARTAEQGQRQVRTPVGVIPCRSFRSDRGRGCVSPKIQPLGLVEMVTSAGERFQLLGRGDDAVPKITRAAKTLPAHLLGTVDLPFLPAAP
ncbi:MAG TPA: hypothetical protein DEB46_11920 [Myxococcales bacterium]|nr:hypothetical protein [Myxococcales bacterium]